MIGLIGDGKMGVYDSYDRIMHDNPANRARRKQVADRIRPLAALFGIFGTAVIILVLVAWVFSIFWTTRLFPSTPEDKANSEADKLLCRVAEACKRYDQVRLECATAGHLGTCLKIKMGSDSYSNYAPFCTPKYYEGAPPGPLSPNTPYAVTCFVFQLFDKNP
jgi:hypothetical protein